MLGFPHLLLIQLSELFPLRFFAFALLLIKLGCQLSLFDLDTPEQILVVDGFRDTVKECVLQGTNELALFDLDRRHDALHTRDVLAGKVVRQSAQHGVERLFADDTHERIIVFSLLPTRAFFGFLTEARSGSQRWFAERWFLDYF